MVCVKAFSLSVPAPVDQVGDVGFAHEVGHRTVHSLLVVDQVVALDLDEQAVVDQALRKAEVHFVAGQFRLGTVADDDVVVVIRE